MLMVLEDKLRNVMQIILNDLQITYLIKQPEATKILYDLYTACPRKSSPPNRSALL